MKITFNSDVLLCFIKQAKVIKDDLGILIRAKGEEIEFVKADLESQISKSFTGDIEQEGSVVLPKEIYSLIKPKTTMTLSQCTMNLGKRIIEVNLKAGDEYPIFEDEFKYEIFDLSDKELKQLLEVEHAVSKDITKPLLTGIHIKDNKFIAIDGFRLSTRTGNFKSEKPITIKNLKLLKSLKGQVKATSSDKYIKYTVNGLEYIGLLIQGEFIDINKLIPKDYNCSLMVNKDVMEATLKDINTVAKTTKNYLVKFNVKDNRCVVKSDTEVIKIKDEFECDTTGEEIDIAFNCKYILDAIKDFENVQIKFTTPVNPAVLLDENKLELVLPIRIAGGIKHV